MNNGLELIIAREAEKVAIIKFVELVTKRECLEIEENGTTVQ